MTDYSTGYMDSILLVEDDPNDVLFFRRAIEKAGVQLSLIECGNGLEAIRFFKREGEYADEQKFPWPKMLVTDLKMPKMGGLELLRWLGGKPEFRVFPTLVLSAGQDSAEVSEAYRLGADAYLLKPTSHEEFGVMVAGLLEFWRFSVRPERSSQPLDEVGAARLFSGPRSRSVSIPISKPLISVRVGSRPRP